MYTLRFRLTLLVMLLLTGTLLAQGKTKNRRRRSASEKPLKTVPYRNIKQITKNIPTLEVADFLAIDLHSKFQLTRAGKSKYAANWFNLGKYWGTFGDFGFDAPKEKYPVVATEEDGCDVVEFKGKQYLRFELEAGTDILETFTLEAWALNPSVEPIETLVSFGAKTPGQYAALNFGNEDIDEINIHSVATIDTSPPTPNPAQIAGVFPMSSSAFYVLAVPGRDPQGEVEYRFTEGVSKTDSGWISNPFWIDRGAELGKKRMYNVVMRDMQENLTAPSKWEMVVPKKVPSYHPNDKGQVVIEAEKYHNQVRDRSGEFRWQKAKGPNASGGYMMEVGPDKGDTAPGQFETEAARMDYRVNFTKPGDYQLWLRGYGPNVTSDSVYAGLDFSAITIEKGAQVSSAPPTATTKRTSRWQRADLKRAIHIEKPGVHVINIWMREDGVLLDKLFLTQGGEAPTNLKHSVDKSIPIGRGDKPSEQEKQ